MENKRVHNVNHWSNINNLLPGIDPTQKHLGLFKTWLASETWLLFRDLWYTISITSL